MLGIATKIFNRAVIGTRLGVSSINVETLTANKTLKLADAMLQSLDPGGSARDVTLPPEVGSLGQMFMIANTADAAEVITVKDDGGNTIVTPTQNESCFVWCDGTGWHGMVGAES